MRAPTRAGSERVASRARLYRDTALRAALLLLALAGGAAAATPGPDAESRSKLGASLGARLAAADAGEELAFAVVLAQDGLPERRLRQSRRAAIHALQQRVLDALPAGQLRVGRRYENLAGFAARARPAVIEALARDPDVVHVYLDGQVHATLAQGVPRIGASVAHAAGFTGTGVNVAVLDTGIDTDHPELQDDILGERCWCDDGGSPLFGCCPNGGESGSGPGSAEDGNGHGTSVSGIITSSGVVAGVGVAPDAGILALKILRDTGTGSFSDVAAALDWLLDNHTGLGVRVVNMSIGDGVEYANPLASPCSGSNVANAISDLVADGLIVFVSSGNEGHDAGISFPACVPEAVSVGGVYDANVGRVSWCGATCSTILCTDNTTVADKFVCHSNSGPGLDLLAPDWRTRVSALGGSAVDFGGTSAAAPYAAGLAALLIEQDPTRTPEALRSLMKSHGPLITNPGNGLAFRRSDVAALFAVCGDGVLGAGEECDDGNQSAGDCCSASCGFEAAGSGCDDGDACSDTDGCDGVGGCSAGAPLACDDGAFCNGDESCDPLTGCVAGAPPEPSDGVVCTLDACDVGLNVITHTPDHAACDDGAWCNGSELCDVVSDCVAGVPPAVDDGIACTLDACDEQNDLVSHTPAAAACDNGLYCDGVEVCLLLTGCAAGAPPTTDDGVDCTLDLCDELAGAIAHLPDVALCDDGDPCTAELCDPLLGCASEAIQGCGLPLPGGGREAWGLLAVLLSSLGVALLVRRSVPAGRV